MFSTWHCERQLLVIINKNRKAFRPFLNLNLLGINCFNLKKVPQLFYTITFFPFWVTNTGSIHVKQWRQRHMLDPLAAANDRRSQGLTVLCVSKQVFMTVQLPQLWSTGGKSTFVSSPATWKWLRMSSHCNPLVILSPYPFLFSCNICAMMTSLFYSIF